MSDLADDLYGGDSQQAAALPDLEGLEQKYNLPSGLLSSVMHQESGGDPNAVSDAGAQGLFQFMPRTAKQYGIDPLDPHQAAEGAARMYADLSKKYNGDIPSMLAGYNWGQGNVDRKGLANAPKETRDYINSVMGRMGSPKTELKMASLEPMSDVHYEAVPQARDLATELYGEKSPAHDLASELYGNENKEESSIGPGKTFVDQAVQGATFGFGDEAESGLAALALSAINGKPISENYELAHKYAQDQLDREIKENPKTAIVGNLAGAIGTGVAGAGTKAGAAVSDWFGGGNLASRVGKGALSSAASGALYGAGAAEEGNRAEGAEQGAKLGAAFGAAIPGIVGAAGAVKSAVGLPEISDTLRPLALKALNYGIPLTRSQISNSGFAKTLASTVNEIPLSGSPEFYAKQQQAFNNAVSKTIGEDATKITPDVVDSAYKNIGQKFNDILKGQIIPVEDEHIQDLAALEGEATASLTADHAAIVQKNIDRLLEDIGSDGTMPGERLGSFQSALTKTLSQTKNDSSPYLHQLRDITFDMATSGDPVKQKALQEARLQYKNLKTIEPLAAKAVDGNISPALLQARVMTGFKSGPNSYARGGAGDLGDLARIGQAFLKETVPNSGTARRMAAYGNLLGAGASLATMNPTPLLATVGTELGTGAAARGFNALNTSQRLVKNAVNGTTKALPAGVTTLLPGEVAGEEAGRNTAQIPHFAKGGLVNTNPTVGENPECGRVYIINQIHDHDGKFDEHKIMIGFPNKAAAIACYKKAFSDGKGSMRIGSVKGMSIQELKDWLKNGDTKKRVA